MKAKSFTGGLFIVGAIGLIAIPTWSQVGRGESTKPQVTKDPRSTARRRTIGIREVVATGYSSGAASARKQSGQ